MNNIELIKKYPWLQIRNVWTNEKLDSEFTWLDDLPGVGEKLLVYKWSKN